METIILQPKGLNHSDTLKQRHSIEVTKETETLWIGNSVMNPNAQNLEYPKSAWEIVPTDTTGKEYFVSIRDGQRAGFLLGPYQTQTEAEKNVRRAEILCEGNPDAAFASFGTCGALPGVVTRTVFGV